MSKFIYTCEVCSCWTEKLYFSKDFTIQVCEVCMHSECWKCENFFADKLTDKHYCLTCEMNDVSI